MKILNILAIINFIGVFIFTIPGLVYFGLLNLLGLIIKDKHLQHYTARCIVAPDQWWNAALRGEEDETVSSRLGRALKSGHPKWGAKMFAHFVNGIFRLIAGQKNHCLESIEPWYQQGAPSDEKWSWIKDEN